MVLGLLEFSNQPGNMYLNPKAHKPPLYPGRMITTGCGSYIENLSALTAYELKKAVLLYRIVDTPHFLRKIDDLNSSNILLGKEVLHVAIDISSMFTNIPRDMGIRQCTKHLNERSSCDQVFSTECIIKALEITVDYNITSFNGITYCQVGGAAMGPKNSCEYADCAMDEIDMLVNGSSVEHGPPHKPAFWGRSALDPVRFPKNHRAILKPYWRPYWRAFTWSVWSKHFLKTILMILQPVLNEKFSLRPL